MQSYIYHSSEYACPWMDPDAKDCERFYLGSDVDARIAELEREIHELVMANTALKAELDYYHDEG